MDMGLGGLRELAQGSNQCRIHPCIAGRFFTHWATQEAHTRGMCVRAKSLQSCLTLCDPMACSLPCSSLHGILQARVLEWGAIAFSETLHSKYKSPLAAAAKLLQSCPTLCDPIDGLPPGSTVPGTLQARILEWVAISFSNA